MLRKLDIYRAIKVRNFYPLLTSTLARTLNMALSKSIDGVAEKLSATQLEVHATRKDVVATFEAVKIIQDETEKEKRKNLIASVTTWLTHTDPDTSHQAAYRKRQPGTGQWLIYSIGFREWKRSHGAFMWLNGIRK
jgi:hypothetical protein